MMQSGPRASATTSSVRGPAWGVLGRPAALDGRTSARRLGVDQTPVVASRELKALAAAFGVEPDISDLATVITQRLEANHQLRICRRSFP